MCWVGNAVHCRFVVWKPLVGMGGERCRWAGGGLYGWTAWCVVGMLWCVSVDTVAKRGGKLF